MKAFSEVLREAKQGNRPAVEVSQIDAAEVVKPGARNPIKKGSPKSKPNLQGPTLPSPEQKGKRFSQSFGTPTGANPFTGRATYTPPAALTNLPSKKSNTAPSPEDYAKTTVGDLEVKRNVRTAEVPGKPGVRAANPEGVRNFAMSQGGFARSGRNMPASEFASVKSRADAIAANPSSPEYKEIESKINQEVGGRRAERSVVTTPEVTPRGRNTAAGQASDAKFRADLELDTPQGAQANRDVAKETQRLARQTAGERSLLAAINKQSTPVTVTPKSPLAPTKAQVAPKQSKTPTQVISQTQQSQRQTQTATPKTTSPKVTSSTRVQSWQGPVAAPTSTPKSTQTVRRLASPGKRSVITQKGLEQALATNRQQKELARQAANTKAAVQNAKNLKNVARIGTGVAAYFDFQRGRQNVLAQGGGNKRADLSGAAEAGARIVGTGLGFVAGTPLGPVGQVAGSVAGGEIAVNKTRDLVSRLTGKPGDPVTSKSVKQNLRDLYKEKVPEKIRRNVSSGTRKGFSDFYDQAVSVGKKGYNLYTRGQKLLDFKPKSDDKI